MANIVQFDIDDTSPSITYSPFGDTFSTPDLSTSWNPYFTNSRFAASQGVTGNGTSFHITSLDGAQVSITWRGTNVQLQGNVTRASYSVVLDGEEVSDPNGDIGQNILATIQNLENTLHTITLTARIPQEVPLGMLAFDQAIVAARPPNVNETTPNNVYTISSLNSEAVSFNGRWSFRSEQGARFHRSDTVGDRAVARFRGTSLLIRGTTSPQSGSYSVTLDNQTVILSAKSSFLSHNSLLYYFTALDSDVTHTVVIRNEGGGTLGLLDVQEGGFRAYALGSPEPDTSPSPPPASAIVGGTAINGGTIAAFVLGGILACILLSGTLYYFCIYRSRQNFKRDRELWRRQTQASFQPSPHDKVAETDDSIIDITRQDVDTTHERNLAAALGLTDSPPLAERARRESGKSSFARWKREVETAVARDSLGIQFRHSFIDNKNGHGKIYTYEGTMESDSDPLTSSSRTHSSPNFRASLMVRKHERASKGGKKAKGNDTRGNGDKDGRVSDYRSWSPSYQINLPFQPPSQEDVAPARAVAVSTLGSLSYLTAAATSGHDRHHEAEASYPGAPPSYTASVLSGGGHSSEPLSVPRSVGQSSSYPTSGLAKPSPKGKERSQYAQNDSSGREQPASPFTEQGSLTSSLTPPLAIRDLSKEDRGSVYDQSIDEEPKVLSGSAVRQVLRSLSPRTSKANFPHRRSHNSMQQRRELSTNVEMGPIQSSSSESPTSPVPLASASRPPSNVPSQPLPPVRESISRPLPPIPQRPESQAPIPFPSAETPSPTSPQQQSAVTPVQFNLTPPAAAGTQLSPVRTASEDSHFPSSGFTSTRFSYTSGSRPGGSSVVPSGISPITTSSQSHIPQVKRRSTRFSLTQPPQQPSIAEVLPMSSRPFRLTFGGSGSSRLQAGAGTSNDNMRDSFLDFSVSSDVSTISKDGYTDTSSARDVRRYSTPPQMELPLPEERSRWSSSNSAGISVRTQGLAKQESDGEEGGNAGDSAGDSKSSSNGRSTRSNPVPTQITIPSNERFLAPHRQHARLSTSESSSRSDPVHVHPPMENLESPVESIPLSGSDVNFHYSDPDEPLTAASRLASGNGRSHMYAYRDSMPPISPFQAQPPSPSDNHASPETDDAGPLPAGLSSPNFLVQRVLGLNSPVSSVTARPPQHSHSRSGSTSLFLRASSASPARFEHPSNVQKHPSDSDVSRTTNP